MKNKEFINMLPIKTERLIIRKTSLEDVDSSERNGTKFLNYIIYNK